MMGQLRAGAGEAAVGVTGDDGLALGILPARRPIPAEPVDQMRGRLFRHPFPPYVAVVGESDVGEDRVALDGIHRHGVAVVARAGCDAEEASLGINGAKVAFRARLDPGDVIPDAAHFPAFFLQAFGAG